MQALPGPPKGVLVAAVAFDDQTESLVETAVSLGERFDMEVRFVNVLDALTVDPWVMEMPGHYLSMPIYRETQEKMIQERRKLLLHLVDRAHLKSPERGVAEVVSGDVPEALVAYAKLHRANLIVTACSSASYRLTPRGFSTALSLMAEAPLPVLVVNRERPLNFTASTLRLLFADDLQPSTNEAARRTYELAMRLGRCRVRQVHVHGDFREMIKESWSDLAGRYPMLATGDAPEETSPTEAVLSRETQLRLERLHARGLPYRQQAETRGASVEVDVRAGNVHDEIHEACQEFDPDLVIFGRHKFFRTRPFLVGRMSFRTMLHDHRPVLLIPPSEALYANLPLPAA